MIGRASMRYELRACPLRRERSHQIPAQENWTLRWD